jgi:Putative rhamnosyl transferase
MFLQHFLLTRFNIFVPFGETTERLKDEWLLQRLRLFLKYCYPSVCGQTNRNFTWLLFFDRKTPPSFLSDLKASCTEVPVQVVLVDPPDVEVLHAVAAREIAGRVKGAELVVTSRLDNDDALCRKYVARVQSTVKSVRDGFINFRNGYVLSDGRAYRLTRETNPFISRVENATGEFDTVWRTTHYEVSQCGVVRDVGGDAAWLRVIHGANASNQLPGGLPRVSLRRVGRECGALLSAETAREGALEVSRAQAAWWLRKAGRVSHRLLGKPFQRMR